MLPLHCVLVSAHRRFNSLAHKDFNAKLILKFSKKMLIFLIQLKFFACAQKQISKILLHTNRFFIIRIRGNVVHGYKLALPCIRAQLFDN